MKIYTKTGDKGNTSLASGQRVSKSHLKVNLYGICDELNSHLGLAISYLPKNAYLISSLTTVQNLLFELGSELAGFRKSENPQESSLTTVDILFLEESIDKMTESIAPLKNFILPGGSLSASQLHISRTVARRLEREMVSARENLEVIEETSLIFINRLSDFLFVAARYANAIESVTEPIWKSRSKGN